MSPEDQRIAIATALGWVRLPTAAGAQSMWGANIGKQWHWCYVHQLPDYLNDLNAMHEAVAVLRERDAKAYLLYQRELFAIDPLLYPDATATQRAQALLRALNLWQQPLTAREKT